MDDNTESKSLYQQRLEQVLSKKIRQIFSTNNNSATKSYQEQVSKIRPELEIFCQHYEEMGLSPDRFDEFYSNPVAKEAIASGGAHDIEDLEKLLINFKKVRNAPKW